MEKLSHQHCKPCEGGIAPLSPMEAQNLLKELPEWKIDSLSKIISKKFEFKGFMRTMSFVNAVAWVVNQEEHHPTLIINYNSCEIQFSTHAINGLSHNDFICAAKIEKLLA